MTRTLIAAAVLTLVLPACARSAQTTEPATADDVAEADEDEAPAKEDADELSLERLDARQVGDVYVHRFSGAALDEPLMLTEEVVDREDHSFVVDYTLETADTWEQFRVRRDERTWQIDSVARVVDGEEVAATLADFEALLERTVVAADSNSGQVGETQETCTVGEAELPCTSRTFEVMIGGEAATLVVTNSEELPGRDLGGVLESDQGEVLYRAELVEMQHGSNGSVARSGL